MCHATSNISLWRKIIQYFKIMNALGSRLTSGTIHTPFWSIYSYLGNITHEDKVQWKGMAQGYSKQITRYSNTKTNCWHIERQTTTEPLSLASAGPPPTCQWKTMFTAPLTAVFKC